jgi:hypothetical protein
MKLYIIPNLAMLLLSTQLMLADSPAKGKNQKKNAKNQQKQQQAAPQDEDWTKMIPDSFKNVLAANGIAGAQGVKGATGPMGPQGPVGAIGAMGPMGPTGPKGDDGVNGREGPRGAMGLQGPQGEKGDTGSQGLLGPTGPAGMNGLNGQDGKDGATGPMGPTGPAGENAVVVRNFASYYFTGTSTLEKQGDVIHFNMEKIHVGTAFIYDADTGCIVFNAPGEYHIMWGASFEEGGAQFALRQNDTIVTGSELAQGHGQSYHQTSGSIIISVETNDALSVVSNSSGPLTLRASAPSSTNIGAHLTIRQL